MSAADSPYAEDWRRVARRDWERTLRSLRDGDAGLAGFLLQQCLEKYLKAFLLTRSWKLRRTHELDTLLDAAVAFDPALSKLLTSSEHRCYLHYGS